MIRPPIGMKGECVDDFDWIGGDEGGVSREEKFAKSAKRLAANRADGIDSISMTIRTRRTI
jgi:hypothetical protein